MTRTGNAKRSATFIPRVSAVATSIMLAMAAVPAAHAVDFSSDKWEGSIDSTFSMGAGWRVEKRDLDKVGFGNGGFAWSNNNDDGDLNFDKGHTFTKAVKGLHEFDLHRKDGGYGLFARASWLYDFELMNGKRPSKELDDDSISRQAKDARMLDVYLWANFEPFDTRLQIRAGEQVINWGESTLIGHSISEANAIDLGKLRVPGAELKEAFIPAMALWASWQITETVGLEAYAQFEWEPVQFDAPGTYLSTQDFIGEVEINENAIQAGNPTPVPSGCNGSLGMVHLLFGQVPESNYSTQACRAPDREVSDTGQGGIKLSWLSEMLGDTEFGFYAINYHNKRPVISATAHDGVRVTGFLEYPEDVKLYGISFNTSTDFGLSIGGEISKRIDEPLQVDDVELLFATLQPVGIIPSGTSQLGNGYATGAEISGYRLIDTYQAQFTLTSLFQNIMGADQFTFLAEFGGNFIPDLPDQDELRFEVAGTVRSGNPNRAGAGMNVAWTGTGCRQINPLNGSAGQCEGVETNEFATKNSWGYRLIGKWDFNNAMFGWNVTPRMVLQHDVKGYTPAPISNFIEGRKSATMGVSFDYLNRWRADVSYSRFFGNDEQDPLSDRDFVALSFGYSI